MGGSPKASATASGRGNQPAGVDPDIKSEPARLRSSRAKFQLESESNPAGVTVEPRPVGEEPHFLK